jgi:hypothetical protein
MRYVSPVFEARNKFAGPVDSLLTKPKRLAILHSSGGDEANRSRERDNDRSHPQDVQPERLSDFRAIFNSCYDDAIQQLASANIKFVSKLAVNELIRRGL